MKIRAAEVHARLGSSWPAILVQLGVPENTLRNKHGPCPVCGGKDRFRFDNKHGRGDFFCNQCRPGDGFKLLRLMHGWSFAEALDRVVQAAGLAGPITAYAPVRTPLPAQIPQEAPRVAMPPGRVLRLRRERCAIENCDDAVSYLASRGLWPLPPGCSLQAHANVEYWDRGDREASDIRRIGRYPALVADVVDGAGELVTLHTTYLHAGKKLEGYEPRKILSPMTGRDGCAVRLMPAADVLGVAEGIETALSAAALDGIPVWAALNTALLSKFEPPPGVTTLRVYADRDEAGLTAALKLLERLQGGRIRVEVCIPTAPSKDWNDTLIARNSRTNGKGSSHE